MVYQVVSLKGIVAQTINFDIKGSLFAVTRSFSVTKSVNEQATGINKTVHFTRIIPETTCHVQKFHVSYEAKKFLVEIVESKLQRHIIEILYRKTHDACIPTKQACILRVKIARIRKYCDVSCSILDGSLKILLFDTSQRYMRERVFRYILATQ